MRGLSYEADFSAFLRKCRKNGVGKNKNKIYIGCNDIFLSCV